MNLPTGAEILVMDSGVSHSSWKRAISVVLSARRRRQLGVKLCEISPMLRVVEALPEPLRQRARHVITEDNRVLEVLQGCGTALGRTDERFSH
jgi:galactokinase